MHWGTKTLYYVESVRKVHEKKYNQIIIAAQLYCGGNRHITGNQTHATSGTEVTEGYEDDCAQIMVSSDTDHWKLTN